VNDDLEKAGFRDLNPAYSIDGITIHDASPAQQVAWMERSGIQESLTLDSAMLHSG